MSTPPTNAAPLVLSDDPRLYESGPRDISTLLTNGWSVYLDGYEIPISRQGSTVTLTVPGLSLDGSAATNDFFLTIPLGFRPDIRGNFGSLGFLSGGDQPRRIKRSFNEIGSEYRGRLDGVLMWSTLDPPPT